ncbi:N-acetylneuraminate synthase [Gallibacter sp. Marseille-QA0791]|uniref:N-acetylneuraminate synthase n=1 Tax=Gallibacter sp. Marseille-QA0791 TaxID=3378781 RepID=UPI003D0ECD74
MEHVCIIAEAGVNHNGDFNLAKKMIDAAKKAGADYIKFQTFRTSQLVSKNAAKADYQKKNGKSEESQFEMLEKLALTNGDFIALKEYCQDVGIGFISTPFDLASIDFLEKLNMDFWKIPSGEVTNLPYLERIGGTGRKIIMSTGMCNIFEIKDALKVLEKSGAGEIVLLHCNTEYPTPFEDVNLNAMRYIESVTNKKVGYSDHTIGLEVPIAAVALGAVVIEKHFTLDRNMEGPDHKASIEMSELASMIRSIRNVEKALGKGMKEPTASERKNILVARKSIVAKKAIKRGEIFTEENITVKRPGTGISPMKWYEVIGKRAKRDFQEDELIEI